MLIVGKNSSRIDRLKKQLSEYFAMKDLGLAKKILGIQIDRYKKKKKLYMSQEQYIKKVLEKFSMNNAKVVSTPLVTHFKLSFKQCPSTDKEKKDMARVPYVLVIRSLMYAIFCIKPYIAHVIGVVNRFFSYLGKDHWNVVKLI